MTGWDPDLTEQRALQLHRLERDGIIAPECPGCQEQCEYYQTTWPDGREPFTPPHRASRGCESGKRAHCTCEVCW